MTIAQAFNEITVAQGGTPNNGGTIAGAIDALNDTLAGSDQAQGRTIEDAVRLLGQHIGGGGSSVTVEALTATENKTYTAPEGKAYSPVTVNVAGSTTEYDILCCKWVDGSYVETAAKFYVATEYDTENYKWLYSGTAVSSAAPGTILTLPDDTEAIYNLAIGNSLSALDADSVIAVPYQSSNPNWFIMPSYNVVANVEE